MKISNICHALALLSMVMADNHHDIRPRQGVFLLSNQIENEVGVWESLDDGELVWKGRYSTQGVGYPDPLDEENLDDLGSSNAVHYHVWNNQQYLLAANAGGPDNTPSMTLFDIGPDLDLTVKHVQPLQGVFPCSVAGYGDRACAVTCALNVTLECFKITDEGTLEPEFIHDFQEDLPVPEGRPNRVSAALGPGNVLFSPNGDQVGIVMKGSAVLGDNHTHQAGFWSFPVTERSVDSSGFGAPSFLELPNEVIPFAFAWRSGTTPEKPIAVTVNIAGESANFPNCDGEDGPMCYSSLTSIQTDLSTGNLTLLQVADENLNVIDGCWVEYRDDRMYTGNFLSDSITVSTVLADGSIEVERTVPIGIETIPNDLASTGPKYHDGAVYIYSENQGIGERLGEVGVHKILSGGLLQVLSAAPLPSGRTQDAWIGNNGLAATSISEEELFGLYNYVPPMDDDDSSDDGSTAAAISFLVSGGVAIVVTLLFAV